MRRDHAFVWPGGFCGICGRSKMELVETGAGCFEADNVVAVTPAIARRRLEETIRAAEVFRRLAQLVPANGPDDDGPLVA